MIPDTTQIQLPVLKLLEDKKSHKIRDVVEKMANHFKITEEERTQLTPVGKRPTFDTRVLWAVSQLRNAGLLENTERGIFKITQRGLVVLKENPTKIDNQLLRKFPEFLQFLGLDKETTAYQRMEKSDKSPIEILEYNYKKLKQDLMQEVLNQLQKCSPYAFEKIVLGLLLKMGYGGKSQVGYVTKKTRDGGIDAVIKEDELGLGRIYVQAKKWKDSVREPEIHKFVGALDGKNAKKGIFITTGQFTQDALNYKEKIVGKEIVLIDGGQLADLLFTYNLGVFAYEIYEIKKLDVEYFEEI
jgi:restriction system protein